MIQMPSPVPTSESSGLANEVKSVTMATSFSEGVFRGIKISAS